MNLGDEERIPAAKRKAQDSTASSTISLDSVINISKLDPSVQRRCAEVTKVAEEARKQKQKKKHKETEQVCSQSEPGEEVAS